MSLSRALMTAAVLGTLLAYAPVREAGFVYEDDVYVSPAARSLPASYYARPRGLTALTFRLNDFLSGSPTRTPQSFHAVNVLLHLLMGLSVYGLARVLAGDVMLAAVAGALFLLHPIASESVAYAAGRAEILAGLGTVWAAWLTASGPLTWARVIGVLACVVFAVGGKETGLMALPLCGFVLLWQGRVCWSRRMVIGALATAAIGVLLLTGIAADRLVGNQYLSLSERHLLGTMAMQSWALWQLLRLVIWPMGFTVDHDFEWVTRTGAVTSLGLLLITGLALLALWRKYPPLPFLVGWLAISLFPRFVVPISELLNEHQIYTPLVGICLVLPALLADADHRLLMWLAPTGQGPSLSSASSDGAPCDTSH